MIKEKTKKAIYAASLICNNKKQNVFYNIQIIEVDREKDLCRIDIQHGEIGTLGTTEEDDILMNLRRSVKKMQEIIASKLSGAGGREYQYTKKVALPNEVTMLSKKTINNITNSILQKKEIALQINEKDEHLIHLINNDKTVAVVVKNINNGMSLQSNKDGKILLNNKELNDEDLIKKSAKRIDEEFHFGGYLEDGIFYVIDSLSEEHKTLTFMERYNIIQDVVLGSRTRAILTCEFYFGKKEKETALKKAIETKSSIKFLELDQSKINEEEHIYPPII